MKATLDRRSSLTFAGYADFPEDLDAIDAPEDASLDEFNMPPSLREPDYPEARKYRLSSCLSIIELAFKWHWGSILLCILSACLNWKLHLERVRLIDGMVFKSIFLVFGFCLGFRNVRANTRMEQASVSLQAFFGNVWSVLFLFPNEVRPRVSKAMIVALQEMANYINEISSRRHWWCAVIDARPKKEGVDLEGCSPRPLLMSAVSLAESWVYKLEDGKIQTKRRWFWALKPKIIAGYDDLVQMTLPCVSDRYAGLLDGCLNAFAVALPWGIAADPVDLRQSTGLAWMFIPASVVMLLNCVFVVTVMSGLNALAQENEDPMGRDEEDVRIRSFLFLFERGLCQYEHRRREVERRLEMTTPKVKRGRLFEGAASKEDIEVWHHGVVCSGETAEGPSSAEQDHALASKLKEQLGLV